MIREPIARNSRWPQIRSGIAPTLIVWCELSVNLLDMKLSFPKTTLPQESRIMAVCGFRINRPHFHLGLFLCTHYALRIQSWEISFKNFYKRMTEQLWSKRLFFIWYLELPISSWSHYYSGWENKYCCTFRNTLCQTTYCMMEVKNK